MMLEATHITNPATIGSMSCSASGVFGSYQLNKSFKNIARSDMKIPPIMQTTLNMLHALIFLLSSSISSSFVRYIIVITSKLLLRAVVTNYVR